MLDDIDKELLERCKLNPGSTPKEIIKPLLNIRDNKTLRARLNDLECQGLLRLDRTKFRGRVLCYITEAGEKALGHAGNQSPEGGDSRGL